MYNRQRAFKNQKETQTDIINQISQDQLKHSDNSIDVRAIAESKDRDNRTAINFEGSAYGAERKADSNPVIQPEMNRYCKQHSIDEDSIRKNKKMSLQQDIDHI